MLDKAYVISPDSPVCQILWHWVWKFVLPQSVLCQPGNNWPSGDTHAVCWSMNVTMKVMTSYVDHREIKPNVLRKNMYSPLYYWLEGTQIMTSISTLELTHYCIQGYKSWPKKLLSTYYVNLKTCKTPGTKCIPGYKIYPHQFLCLRILPRIGAFIYSIKSQCISLYLLWAKPGRPTLKAIEVKW